MIGCALALMTVFSPMPRAEAPSGGSEGLRDAPGALPAARPAGFMLGRPGWERLALPGPGVLGLLRERLPERDLSQARELTFTEAAELLDRAAARGLTALDVFTDPGLREDAVYVLGPETLARLDAAFDLKLLLPLSGKTLKGEPFAMRAVVMGGGRIDYLYDREVVFRHPVYTSHGGKMRVKPRVTQTVEKPGVARFQGVWGPWGAAIRALVKTAPERVRAVTSLKDEENALYPVRRR